MKIYQYLFHIVSDNDDYMTTVQGTDLDSVNREAYEKYLEVWEDADEDDAGNRKMSFEQFCEWFKENDFNNSSEWDIGAYGTYYLDIKRNHFEIKGVD